jgi:hypothetical protein
VKATSYFDRRPLDAKIQKLIATEFEGLKGSPNFRFDWSLERHSDVYKIVLLSDLDEILGLIMLTDEPSLRRIHIELLESSIINQGADKKLDNIAGCLIAFAISLSFKVGYLGYVSLEPKGHLIGLYRDKYGFEEVSYLMISQVPNSQEILNKYLYNEEE